MEPSPGPLPRECTGRGGAAVRACLSLGGCRAGAQQDGWDLASRALQQVACFTCENRPAWAVYCVHVAQHPHMHTGETSKGIHGNTT